MDKGKEERISTSEKTLNSLVMSSSVSKGWFALLLFFYIAASVMTTFISRSDAMLTLGGVQVPITSMTGVVSSIANICAILLVLYFGDMGFVVSISLILLQLPMMILNLAVRHNFTTIAGFFSNLLTIIAIVIIYQNNVKLRKFQVRLREQAITDRLTGLPNRFASSELMGNLVRKNEKFALAVINLSNFKNINYTMGQSTGNAVLVNIANHWKEIADEGKTGTTDFITSQGGDEFSLIIRDYKSEDEILNTIKCYKNAIKEAISVDGVDYYISANIGYACYPEDARNGDGLLSCANAALAGAKSSNDNDHILRFNVDILGTDRTLEIEREIMAALETGRMDFDLQPQYDMDHNLSGFEALARIRKEDGTVISPGEFIPVAERVGLVDKIDYAVFSKSMAFFGDLIKKTGTGITLSVNVSVKHLMKNNFINEVRSVLSSSGVPANQLELEITESIMIDSIERAIDCIEEIKKMGVKVAIDDFGTGYSSLSYLNSFPADLLKVDKAFIDQMDTNEASRKYIAAIISIGHVMDFDVISEGVEKEDQLATLKKIGCDYIQGFIWGRPMPADSAAKLVEAAVAKQE